MGSKQKYTLECPSCKLPPIACKCGGGSDNNDMGDSDNTEYLVNKPQQYKPATDVPTILTIKEEMITNDQSPDISYLINLALFGAINAQKDCKNDDIQEEDYNNELTCN